MTNELAMNVEEDAELRELLISNLESRGVLSRIKADLRAAIFQCLDEKGQNLAEVSQDAKLPLSLCADLLETLGLYSTNKVLQTECSSISNDLIGREPLANQLGLSQINDSKRPILNYLLDAKSTNALTTNGGSGDSSVTITAEKLKEKAQAEFSHYDHGQFNQIHIDDAGSALMDLFPSVSENQATFLFNGVKTQELTFEEWFRVVQDFHAMCGKVHLCDAKMENKDVSGLNFDLLNKTADDSNFDQAPNDAVTNHKTEDIMTSRTNYSADFSDFNSKTNEVTEGALPDSDSEVSTTDNFTFSKNQVHNELTEDFSVRSDDASKYADFIENV